jgi:hypothetical protein
MKELENFRKFLTEESTPEGNKYYIQDEDGEWILDYDAAIDYLSQFKKRKAVERFIYDDEVFEDLPYDYEEHPNEEDVEGVLKNAMDFYFGDI